MKNKLETRLIHEVRVADESRDINGTAIVFNSESEDLGFREVIAPEAFGADLISSSDILMLFNHRRDDVPLARSKNGKGTLKITVDDNGANFNFKAKKTAQGDEILEAVRNGDLAACSFAFRVAEGGETWEKRSDGSYLRTINKFSELADFSIVTNPAYAATSVDTRGLDAFKAAEKREEVNENVTPIPLEDKEVEDSIIEPVAVIPDEPIVEVAPVVEEAPVPVAGEGEPVVVIPEPEVVDPEEEDLEEYYSEYEATLDTLQNAE